MLYITEPEQRQAGGIVGELRCVWHWKYLFLALKKEALMNADENRRVNESNYASLYFLLPSFKDI